MRKPDKYTPFHIFKAAEEALYTAKNRCDDFERKHLNGKLFDEVVAEDLAKASKWAKSLVVKTETKTCMEQVLEIIGDVE